MSILFIAEGCDDPNFEMFHNGHSRDGTLYVNERTLDACKAKCIDFGPNQCKALDWK